jgi:hypothetical protein
MRISPQAFVSFSRFPYSNSFPSPSYDDVNIRKYARDQLEVVADATGKEVRIIVIR